MPTLSAFAARQAHQKARQAQYSHISGNDESTPSEPKSSFTTKADEQGPEEPDAAKPLRETKRQRKKRRLHSRESGPRSVSPASESVDIITATPLSPTVPGASATSESDKDSEPNDTDPTPLHAAIATQTQPPFPLSTVSSPTILVDLGTKGYTVSLRPGERLAFVGLYILRVDRGAVRVLGATIKGPSQAYQVYAPSTHSLPMIEHVQNPFGAAQTAEVTLLSSRPQIDKLGRLSPLFDGIWADETRAQGRSFAFVRHWPQCRDHH